ncbi:MAG: GNAT family N-acetyltransferase [Halococcoides sp.]
MNCRPAEAADRPAIRDVARRSIQASYSLSPQAITDAIEEWYAESRITETLDDDDHLLLVAEIDDQVVGFSESTLTESHVEARGASNAVDTSHDATILWVHVDPAYRGSGVGSRLFEGTRDRLDDRGATRLRAQVLADNSEGAGFYEDYGLERVGQQEREIAGRSYVEYVYVEEPSGIDAIEADGETVYVDRDEAETGSIAPLFVVYRDEERKNRYGYYCGNCESLANAMDAMGRIECANCGNARKPTRWDAAYM